MDVLNHPNHVQSLFVRCPTFPKFMSTLLTHQVSVHQADGKLSTSLLRARWQVQRTLYLAETLRLEDRQVHQLRLRRRVHGQRVTALGLEAVPAAWLMEANGIA